MFYFVTRSFLAVATVVTLYPFVYVVSMSFSALEPILQQKVWLFPVGVSFKSYRLVFQNPEVLRSYYNTVWYAVVGTSMSLLVTYLGAYSLSRAKLIGRKYLMLIVILTMYFEGGLVPMFILIYRIGIFNTRWAIILPPLVNTFNLIICITFLKSLPSELIDSAKIDGCNDITILAKIIVPMSLPIIAVLVLYYAIDRWNSFFGALLYLRNSKLQPIQIYLMKVLVQNSESVALRELDNMVERAGLALQIRYALIVVTMIPIMMIYPFAQKYFVRGVMIGSLKG